MCLGQGVQVREQVGVFLRSWIFCLTGHVWRHFERLCRTLTKCQRCRPMPVRALHSLALFVYMWRQRARAQAPPEHAVSPHTSHSPPLCQATTCLERRGINKSPFGLSTCAPENILYILPACKWVVHHPRPHHTGENGAQMMDNFLC